MKKKLMTHKQAKWLESKEVFFRPYMKGMYSVQLDLGQIFSTIAPV